MARIERFDPRARMGRDRRRDLVCHFLSLFRSTRPHGARPPEAQFFRDVQWFRSTRPHGARRLQYGYVRAIMGFDPRARMGRDLSANRAALRVTGFDPRARMGRDRGSAARSEPSEFRSTRPHGARRARSTGRADDMAFRSTRPHGARPDAGGNRQRSDEVSIHAPAWGATRHGMRLAATQRAVSIHAPAWGATASIAMQCDRASVSIHAPAWGATSVNWPRRGTGFDPRARMGRDPGRWSIANAIEAVSIHAPAWGATCVRSRPARYRMRFDPRARMGRDARTSLDLALDVFRSTRPHGARRTHVAEGEISERFDPRARMGRDAQYERMRRRLRVSIHAPAWGATTAAWRAAYHAFRSTRPHGARRSDRHALTAKRFRSTRPHGARPAIRVI